MAEAPLYPLGTRVRALQDFAGVPRGTEGVIDEFFDGGLMVAWDLPDHPLPPGYYQYGGAPAISTGILRDGFSTEDGEIVDGLEVVP